jgi:hypothetical protein
VARASTNAATSCASAGTCGHPADARHAAQRRTSVRNASRHDGAIRVQVAAADAPKSCRREPPQVEESREIGGEICGEGRLGASASESTSRGSAPGEER